MFDTTIHLYSAPNFYTISQGAALPKFKDEIMKAPRVDGKLAKRLWDALCGIISTSEGKVVEKKGEDERNTTFFFHVARTVGSTENEVRKKVKSFISINQPHVLALSRKISEQSRLAIDTINSSDFLSLISCKNRENHKQSILKKILGEKQALKHLHLANYTLAAIIAEIYSMNVSLRDMFVQYDHSLIHGIGIEQVSIEARSEGATKTLELIQGWGMLSHGFLSEEPVKMYHFSPAALTQYSQSSSFQIDENSHLP